MVNTVPVAESIPVQSSWQVGGGGWWWCCHTGCSASDWERGSAPPRTPFHDFVEIFWGTRITSAHCQLRRKSMIAVSLTQKEVRPVQQQEFPGLFARKASLASFAGWVRARGIW